MQLSGLPLKSFGANSLPLTILAKRNASSNDASASPVCALCVLISVLICVSFRFWFPV
jgi:hypothetical protein